MRRLVVHAVTVLALLGSVACGALPGPFHRAPPATGVVYVFLTQRVTAVQARQVGDVLKRTPGVRRVEFRTREQMYERAKKVLKDKPELLRNLSPDALAPSYVVRLADRGTAERVMATVRKMPGVDQVRLQPTARPS